MRTAALAVLALWVGYLLLANLMLGSHLVPWLVNQKTLPSAKVGYTWAWSLWPGDLRIRNFLLNVDDPAIRMEIRVDSIVTHVQLLSLLRQRFHCDWVRGTGARLRVRGQPELSQWSAVEWWQPKLPRTSERYLGRPQGPPPDVRELFWVELNDVALDDVRELWIAAAHFTGEAKVRGHLRLLPTQQLEVQPTHLELVHGQVHVGDRPVLTAVSGRGALWIPPTRLLPGQGPDHTLRGHLSLDALTDVSALEPLLDGVSLDCRGERGCPGTLRAQLSVEGGRLAAGSALRWDLRELAVGQGALRADGAGLATLRVDADGAVHAGLELARVRLLHQGVALAAAPTVKVRALLDGLAMHGPPPLTALWVDAPSLRVDSLGALGSRLPALGPVALRSGEARGALSLFFPELSGPGRGALTAKASRAELEYAAVPVRADLALTAPLSGVRLWPLALRLDGSRLAVTRLTVGQEARADWWANLHLREGEAHTAGAGRFEGVLEAELKDARPVLGLFVKAKQLPGWTRELLSVPGARAAVKLEVTRAGTFVDGLRVWGEGVQLIGRLNARPSRNDGALLLRVRGLEVGLALEGDTQRFILAGASAWYREQAAPRLADGL